MKVLTGVLVVILLAGCSSSGPDVDWNRYPGVKQRIDRLTNEHRCRALTQIAFASTANAFSGERDPDFDEYLDGKMQEAGCV